MTWEDQRKTSETGPYSMLDRGVSGRFLASKLLRTAANAKSGGMPKRNFCIFSAKTCIFAQPPPSSARVESCAVAESFHNLPLPCAYRIAPRRRAGDKHPFVFLLGGSPIVLPLVRGIRLPMMGRMEAVKARALEASCRTGHLVAQKVPAWHRLPREWGEGVVTVRTKEIWQWQTQ